MNINRKHENNINKIWMLFLVMSVGSMISAIIYNVIYKITGKSSSIFEIVLLVLCFFWISLLGIYLFNVIKDLFSVLRYEKNCRITEIDKNHDDLFKEIDEQKDCYEWNNLRYQNVIGISENYDKFLEIIKNM